MYIYINGHTCTHKKHSHIKNHQGLEKEIKLKTEGPKKDRKWMSRFTVEELISTILKVQKSYS